MSDRIPLHPDLLAGKVKHLMAAYPPLSCHTLGESLLGRRIPLLCLGAGEGRLLYVGAHHGAEWLTATLLLRFIEELARAYLSGARPYGLDLDLLLSVRTLCFVPMLNPDGVAIALGDRDDPLFECRRRAVPNGDFSRWQANARGVDLNHNYRVGFAEYKRMEAALGITGCAPTRYSGERPESEPESAAMAAYIRRTVPRLVLSLHTQGEEIYWRGGGVALPGARAMAGRMAALSGYRVAEPCGAAAYGGLCDYTTAGLGIPSFTLECGLGENPLPPEKADGIYARLRRLLFESITM